MRLKQKADHFQFIVSAEKSIFLKTILASLR
jgi:hypothetical protein